jgi:putative Ca2+/H+ antiporter (TMEM165/GDT1 family)
MHHPKSLVFGGVIAALASMAVISVLLGQATTFLPRDYVRYGRGMLLLIFGLSLIWQARRMPKHACLTELQSAEEAIKSKPDRPQQYRGMLGILLQAFALTFIGEWGDRTQFATVTLAAGNHAVEVTLGAILGHSICTVIAITSGCLLAERISERSIAYIGGRLFLLFAAIACFS